ncbi:MAG TPA: DUF4177 domain-containing protein [Chloroflexia bacterium]|nr:DUF4177 domain-containing protein [Chloroflexia bacterium]
MASWEYKVVYMDFRGRASVEGDEQFIAKEERRSAFARRVMNSLGAEGWEMVGVQPLWPAETSYLVFKREGTGDFAAPAAQPDSAANPSPAPPAAEPSGAAPGASDQPTTVL